MNDEDTVPGTTAGAIDVDTLPVQLVFVAGETEVALRDLQRLSDFPCHGP